jgi:hypothetical protein
MTALQKEYYDRIQKTCRFPIFEIPVIEKRSGNRFETYVIFNISFGQRSMTAQHEATTAKEEQSKKIAHCKIIIDRDFSLDANLQELYSACIDKIIHSDFFELTD